MYMKKEYLIFPVVVTCALAVFLSYYNENEGELKPQCVRLPKESVYVGSIIFSDGEPRILGADYENGEQVRRVSGVYVARLDEHFLVIEIYSWGSRTLFKEERYRVSELKRKYPVGVSIWVEQDAVSATVVFVPWE